MPLPFVSTVLTLFVAHGTATAVSFTGYLVDNYCWDKPNHRGIDGTPLGTHPYQHILHCLTWIPCKATGRSYAMLQPKCDMSGFEVAYQLDDCADGEQCGRTKVIAFVEQELSSNGDRQFDNQVTITGTVSGNHSDGNPLVTVATVTIAGTTMPGRPASCDTSTPMAPDNINNMSGGSPPCGSDMCMRCNQTSCGTATAPECAWSTTEYCQSTSGVNETTEVPATTAPDTTAPGDTTAPEMTEAPGVNETTEFPGVTETTETPGMNVSTEAPEILGATKVPVNGSASTALTDIAQRHVVFAMGLLLFVY